MAEPPEIVTPRLRLVPPVPDFATDVYDYSRDEEFCRYIDARPPLSVAESRIFLESLARENALDRRCYWVATLRTNGGAVGTLGFLFPAGEPDFGCQVGYGIARTHWGTGLFQEALRAVLDHGFTVFGFDRVFVLTRRENIRAARSVEKLGFQWFRTIAGQYRSGTGTDAVALCLTRDRFAGQRRPEPATRGA